ncbi:hypothetical protein IQ260_29725 [Leptolyngbya cf. ectocarpi LEGE 11479]|uniref:Alpha 1,4-glycosyltransferase domain-containing protein n=1 Tax=Leptolyngbya cf. ectocarpi LEGE 11479 TaxID=1828722 RepID=A0A929A0B3_LEPEC|nr:glycosyltransferase [Leptolyngbya ectocarpi]MBE9070819.1 hypothetical protein [Leptolyngbya cf. ectocarpi LEGE 11479]
MSHIVQGLWIGKTLSTMEQLSIQSFLRNNHEYHLYVYGSVDNIPDGTKVMDGNHILPESDIFTYQHASGTGSYAGFANFFRYKLLLMKGGWWVDTDVICLKPFIFSQDYIFASEWKNANCLSTITSSGILKAPQESSFAQFCWDFCSRQNPQELKWGVTGPYLVQSAIDELHLNDYVYPPQAFSPLVYTNIRDLIAIDNSLEELIKESYAIHLWNEMWRRQSIDKNGTFVSGCLYEKLKSKYL